MKILNVNMSLDPVLGGGTVERTIQISRELSRSGVKAVILTTDIGLPEEYIKGVDGVEIIALPCLVKRFYFPKFSYKFIKELVAKSDVVHLMGHWTFINALVYCAARQLKKPYVICPAGALPIYGRSQVIKKLYNFFIGKEIIRNAKACIAIAVNEEARFKAYGIGADKITFIPNGINCADFKVGDENAFRSKYNIGSHPFILFMGRLNHIKGPDLLLRAFCEAREGLEGYHLVFAGPDGGMLAELKNTAAQFSFQDRVHFV
ncbi:MAG: glycosyltransferase, partial [Candidatus Omnitrophota bacterium]